MSEAALSTPRFTSVEGARAALAKVRDRIKEKGHEIKIAVEDVVLPSIAIAVFGILEGYYGPDKVRLFGDKNKPQGSQGGFPIVLGVTFLGYVAVAAGMAGNFSHEALQIANGGLFYTEVGFFQGLGQKWRKKADDAKAKADGTAPPDGTPAAGGYRGPRFGAAAPTPMFGASIASHHGVFQPEEALAFQQAARNQGR